MGVIGVFIMTVVVTENRETVNLFVAFSLKTRQLDNIKAVFSGLKTVHFGYGPE